MTADRLRLARLIQPEHRELARLRFSQPVETWLGHIALPTGHGWRVMVKAGRGRRLIELQLGDTEIAPGVACRVLRWRSLEQDDGRSRPLPRFEGRLELHDLTDDLHGVLTIVGGCSSDGSANTDGLVPLLIHYTAQHIAGDLLAQIGDQLARREVPEQAEEVQGCSAPIG